MISSAICLSPKEVFHSTMGTHIFLSSVSVDNPPFRYLEARVENKKIDAIANVEGALEDIKNGKFVIVQDAASRFHLSISSVYCLNFPILLRENEGDLIIAAEKVTPEKMAFMVNYTSGIICVGITPERCKDLELPQVTIISV